MPPQSSRNPSEVSVPHRHQGLSSSHLAAGVALELCPAPSCSSHDVLLLRCPKDSKNFFFFFLLQKEGAIKCFLFLYFPRLGHGGNWEQRERAWLGTVLLGSIWAASLMPWGGSTDRVWGHHLSSSRTGMSPTPGRTGEVLHFHSMMWSCVLSISISKSCLFSRFLIFLYNGAKCCTSRSRSYTWSAGYIPGYTWSLSLLAWRGLDITSSLLLCLGACPGETGAFIL